MNIKRRAVYVLLTGILAAAPLNAESSEDIFSKGIEQIEEENFTEAAGILQDVMGDQDAPGELRFRAALWSAHAFLEEDKRSEASDAIRNIFHIENFKDLEDNIIAEIEHKRDIVQLYNREKRVFSRGLENIEKDIARAHRLVERKRVSEAENLIRDILSADPGNAEAETLMEHIEGIKDQINEGVSEIYLQIKEDNISAARAVFNEVSELAEDNEQIREAEKIIKREEERLKSTYNQISELMEKAQKYFSGRNYRKAADKINEILKFKEVDRISEYIREERETVAPEDEKAEADFNPETLFAEAVEEIQNYEMEEALDKIKLILSLKDTPESIRYKSYFIKATVHNFNNNRLAARQAFLSLMKSGLAERFTITSLPAEVMPDSELIEVYNSVLQQYEKGRGMSYESIIELINRAGIMAEDIRKINEILINARRDFIDYVYESARNFYESGDYISAAQKADIILTHNPSHHMASYILESSRRRLSSLPGFTSEEDVKYLRRAVESYLAGNYRHAVGLFKRIRDVDPNRFDILIAQALIQEKNQRSRHRADLLLLQASGYADNNFYSKAEENILRAIMLDSYNMEAVVFLEEIRYIKSRLTAK